MLQFISLIKSLTDFISALSGILTPVLTTLAGGAVGFWVAKRTALKLYPIMEFTKAGTEFRTAFMNVLGTIKAEIPAAFNETQQISYVVDKEFTLHKAAMYKFLIHLPKGKDSEFLESWERYHRARLALQKDDPNVRVLRQQQPKPDEKEQRQIFKDRIEELFEFTYPENIF